MSSRHRILEPYGRWHVTIESPWLRKGLLMLWQCGAAVLTVFTGVLLISDSRLNCYTLDYLKKIHECYVNVFNNIILC